MTHYAHFASNSHIEDVELPIPVYLCKMSKWFSSSFETSKQLRLADYTNVGELYHHTVKLERVP